MLPGSVCAPGEAEPALRGSSMLAETLLWGQKSAQSYRHSPATPRPSEGVT